MTVVLIPGFWDFPDKFTVFKSVLEKNGYKVYILDYRDYRKYSKFLTRDIFFKLFDRLLETIKGDYILISYSMGCGFCCDYLLKNQIHPKKVIFIDPLMHAIKNPFIASYLRLLDLYLEQKYYKKSKLNLGTMFKNLDVPIYQSLYNFKLRLDRKLGYEALFLWGENDRICTKEFYDDYKKLFKKARLNVLSNLYHNWLVYEEPVTIYLIPALKSY